MYNISGKYHIMYTCILEWVDTDDEHNVQKYFGFAKIVLN